MIVLPTRPMASAFFGRGFLPSINTRVDAKECSEFDSGVSTFSVGAETTA
jgi:hypothetical protein